MLKVYAWQSHRREASRRTANSSGQTHEIVAANSKAEVGRIVGVRPTQLFNLGETGNKIDIATATSRPGVVFWCPIDEAHRVGRRMRTD